MKPQIISIKAINQYRRTDIFLYIGLRYYLNNISARKDIWAREVATKLVICRNEPAYFKTQHFKAATVGTDIKHRTIHIPGPNEAIAEAALLVECSKFKPFHSKACVHSYNFAHLDSTKGIFSHYFDGYKVRHEAISSACLSGGLVLCTDIKEFYPSIKEDVAKDAWLKACKLSGISNEYIQLGEKILNDHASQGKSEQLGCSLLTGPLFSHLIGNLVLSKIDDAMVAHTNGRYWRYVDDIAFTGTQTQVNEWRKLLSSMLDSIDLKLHSGNKNFDVQADEWASCKDYFNESVSLDWARLIRSIRLYLIRKPLDANALAAAFSDNDIRIPIQSYKQIAMESSYLKRLSTFLSEARLREFTRSISIHSIIGLAQLAKSNYTQRFLNCISGIENSVTAFEKKKLISRLRFYGGRLVMIADLKNLHIFAKELKKYDELYLLSEIMSAVATRDVSVVATLGHNATQSVAQILKLSTDPVYCNMKTESLAFDHSLSVLRLHGLKIETNYCSDSPIYNLASSANNKLLEQCSDGFVKEIACLHGFQSPYSHSSVIDESYDYDEQLVFDVIDQMHQSGSDI